jgi:hypothetical protein
VAQKPRFRSSQRTIDQYTAKNVTRSTDHHAGTKCSFVERKSLETVQHL